MRSRARGYDVYVIGPTGDWSPIHTIAYDAADAVVQAELQAAAKARGLWFDWHKNPPNKFTAIAVHPTNVEPSS